MAHRRCTCVHCGKAFIGRGNGRYCSNGCKQMAYRARRKQIEISRQQTMTMDEYTHFKFILDRCPNSQFAIEEMMLVSNRALWQHMLINLADIVRDARRKHTSLTLKGG